MIVAGICQFLQTSMLLEQSVDLSLEHMSSQEVLLVPFFGGLISEHMVLNELALEEFENKVCDRDPGFGLAHLSVLCVMLQSVLK